LLENPMGDANPPLLNAFLSALTDARDRGCAVVWLAPDDTSWRAYETDASIRLRLYDDGLFSMRGS
ncbi:ABC transporter ATP-binding protein, partial [Gluconobacter japonicus]